MVYQSQPINEIETEVEFPGTDAIATSKNPNGFEIDYYDNKNEPCSIFINGRSWDKVLADFESRIDYTLINAHRPAKMAYDL